MKNIPLPTTKRLEIASLLAGLVGIFLTWSGLSLPWGLVEWGKNGEVLIAFSGFSSLLFGEGGIINPLVIFPLLVPIPCYVFMLLIQRNSKQASVILATAGLCIMLQTLMWIVGIFPIPGVSYTYYPAYILDIGVYSTVIGSLFILLAGLLSLLRIRLMPADTIVASRRIGFKTYLVKRFLVFVVTLIGITFVVFWLYLLYYLQVFP